MLPFFVSSFFSGECGMQPVDSTDVCSVLAIEVLTGYVGTAPDTAALLTSTMSSDLDNGMRYSIAGVTGATDASVLVGATSDPGTTPADDAASTTPDSDSGTDTATGGGDPTPDSTGQDPAASPEEPETSGAASEPEDSETTPRGNVVAGIKGLDGESTSTGKSMSAGPIVGISMACMSLIAVVICVLLVRKQDRYDQRDKLVRKMTDDEDDVLGYTDVIEPAAASDNGRSSRSASPRGGASVSSRSRSGALARVVDDDDSAWHSKSSIPASQHGNNQRYSFPVDGGYDSQQPVNIRVAPSKHTDDDQSIEVESVQGGDGGGRFSRVGSANSNRSRYGVCFVTTEQSAPQLQFQNSRDYQAGDTVDL
jgi:hypothetical protein